MKPHQVREMVNELRDVAVIYSDTHQLRDRIAHVVHKYLAEPQSDLAMVGMLFEENQRLLCEISQLTKREWVGLTDEDLIQDVVRECIVDFYRRYLNLKSNEDITVQVDRYVREHFGVE
jgi:hypothetical protein